MKLVRFPSSKKAYVVGATAGLITCFGATFAGRLLVYLGLHADLTYLDDGLLGLLIAIVVLLLHRHYDFERAVHQANVARLVTLHESIAADLHLIASTTGNPALAEIAMEASARIHATLETLPTPEDLVGETATAPLRRHARRMA